jgi:raffinose/stachyose/melibiose transport system permease protein
VIINELGLSATRINWFGNRWLALSVIIIASVWTHFGINMVFFLMGLQSVPKELYECADIDGANRFKQFYMITLPMLKPIMQIILMLAVVEGMKLSELPLVLTNGQPGGQTEVVMTYIYKYFFPTDSMSGGIIQYGYASSLAVVAALIIGIITLLYLKMSKRMSDI